MGSFIHACEGEMVCESVNSKLPYFNAPIYLENKASIGDCNSYVEPNIILDFNWQSGRSSGPNKPGLLYDQAAGGHRRNIFQGW